MQKILLSTLLSTLIVVANADTDTLESLKEPTKATNQTFMPNISLIVDASYSHETLDNEDETEHLEIPGFVHGGGDAHEGHMHTPLAGNDGFNLNYAELSLTSSVDNYFDMTAIFHLTEDNFEIEEAFITTTALPYNLKAKLGKFNSDFGYLNAKHHHAYNFSDMPLIYAALLGDHGFNEKGVQLQYVLPTSTYMMVGVELLEGENELSYGKEGFSPSAAGEDFVGVDGVDKPLMIAYLKSSFDIAGGTVLTGGSLAMGESRIDHLEDAEGPHAFAGDSTLYGVDFTYKNFFSTHNGISFHTEYLYRELDGTQYAPNATNDDWKATPTITKKQGGFYSELIYQFDQNYRAGVRYSAITQNDVTLGGVDKDMEDDIAVTSVMAEYNPSEFARIRLQYNHNSSLFDENGIKNNKDEIVLQFNYAIGAHGAHNF